MEQHLRPAEILLVLFGFHLLLQSTFELSFCSITCSILLVWSCLGRMGNPNPWREAAASSAGKPGHKISLMKLNKSEFIVACRLINLMVCLLTFWRNHTKKCQKQLLLSPFAELCGRSSPQATSSMSGFSCKIFYSECCCTSMYKVQIEIENSTDLPQSYCGSTSSEGALSSVTSWLTSMLKDEMSKGKIGVNLPELLCVDLPRLVLSWWELWLEL